MYRQAKTAARQYNLGQQQRASCRRHPPQRLFVQPNDGGLLHCLGGLAFGLESEEQIHVGVEVFREPLLVEGEVGEDERVRARDERSEAEYERRADGVPAQKAAAIAVSIAERLDRPTAPSPTQSIPPLSVDQGPPRT